MEAFTKLTSMLLNALETREPVVDLLDSFVDNWKSITNYYIQTTDETRPVKETDIPWRLRQMLDILVYEEKQQGVEETGACMEYLLQHKILETLCTLGKAQYPPGMSQQVLIFFSKVLSQIQKPLLHLVHVSRPVKKLIRLCALPGSQMEKEEAQFLLVVCSRIKQDPHVLSHVLEIVDQPAAPNQSQASNQKSEPESGLLQALLQLTKSQRGSVCLKAYEGLLLLAGLQTNSSGDAVEVRTQLGVLLSRRLVQLYSLLPMWTLEPAEVQNFPHTTWSSQFSSRSSDDPASDHMTNVFCWFDFLDHLTMEAPEAFGVTLAQCLHQSWMLDVLQPQLRHTSERVVLISTSVLCATVRLVRSKVLLDQLVHFLLGSHDPTLTPLLLQRCNHISDQISMASLSLVEELLQKPHRDILDVLVLSDLRDRGYLTPPPACQEDRPTECSEVTEDGEDLEEDPFFSESLLLPSPPDSSPSSSASPPCHPGTESTADAVNSFLCLLPVQCRSAQLLQEGGYESYVHDAHTLVMECQSLSETFHWQVSLPLSSSSQDVVFFEGHLLKVLLDRVGRILEQPYELNLQLTAVLSRLCAFNHPLLNEYLLNPYVHLSDQARSLFSVLIRVMGQLMQRVQHVSNLSDRLLKTRKDLLGLDQDTGSEHRTLLRGVIVLEEFCKELAAIAFVKLPLDQDSGTWTRTKASETGLRDLDWKQDRLHPDQDCLNPDQDCLQPNQACLHPGQV